MAEQRTRDDEQPVDRHDEFRDTDPERRDGAVTDRRDEAGADRRTEVVGDRREAPLADRREREKAEFGGMRFFLAFFGWLTATGAVVLLTALVTGVLGLIGLNVQMPTASDGNVQAAAAAGGIAVLAFVLFAGYWVGGYVAGRMARFSGAKQGLAVWLWAVIIAVVVAVAGAIAGAQSGAFSQLNATGLPISGSIATTTGIWALVVAIVFSLGGALLGGLAGMRFHRKVDRFTAGQV
ncbi:hypothetical protein [Amnibacterium endophyticum]|uniref:Major facilitator superfamily (MFS) profile domain-containing protein n=1 Tax=Amnibacterium endophyticum TaxID=2109337 RepID=A0ABW4L9U5_9MICO